LSDYFFVDFYSRWSKSSDRSSHFSSNKKCSRC